MKIKLIDLADELQVALEVLLEKARQKVPNELSGKGKNTWITAHGANELRLNEDLPEAVPECYQGKVLHEAPNALWVYCAISDLPGKHRVLVGRRWGGDRLIGKTIPIHRIQDQTGVTFRHAELIR